MTRSVEVLVEEQARRWELARRQQPEKAPGPVITVGRLHGAGGEELAQRLATELGFDLFDREIIQRIAASSHLSERVVSALDEKNRELLTDWLTAVASQSYLSPAEYRYHLTRVVGAIAHAGSAVILGRASHLILGQGRALRVLVVAPLEHRVRNVMEQEGLSERDARRRIVVVESELRAYLMQHFHADFSESMDFDLVVNTAVFGVEGACQVVRTALTLVPAHPANASLPPGRA